MQSPQDYQQAKEDPITYSLAETHLDWVDSYQYLGVIINSKLKWGEHCHSVAVKATRVLNLLCRTIYGCRKKAKERVYKALVRLHLKYCCPVWTPHTQTNRDTIEKVQKRAARWTNARWDGSTKKWSRSYDESLAELHWSTIEQRHSYLSLCQVYKIVNRLDCINFTDYFSPSKAPQTRYCKVNSLQCMPSHVNAFRYLLTHLLFGIHCLYPFLLHLHMLHSS